MSSSVSQFHNFNSTQEAVDWINNQIESTTEERVEVKLKVNNVAFAILCPSKVGIQQNKNQPPAYLAFLLGDLDKPFVDAKVRCLENSADCLKFGREIAAKLLSTKMITSYTLERGIINLSRTRVMCESSGTTVGGVTQSLEWTEGFVPDNFR